MNSIQKYKIGHILEEVKEGIIIQQVNAQGVMGSGFAKAIRDKWPTVWEAYSGQIKPNQPDKGLLYMGRVIYVEVEPGLVIANIVGQQFYGREPGRQYTSYEALEMGLFSVGNLARNTGCEVHYPTIGCGLGGGDWITVSALLDRHLDTISHTLWEQPQQSLSISKRV